MFTAHFTQLFVVFNVIVAFVGGDDIRSRHFFQSFIHYIFQFVAVVDIAGSSLDGDDQVVVVFGGRVMFVTEKGFSRTFMSELGYLSLCFSSRVLFCVCWLILASLCVASISRIYPGFNPLRPAIFKRIYDDYFLGTHLPPHHSMPVSGS